MVDMGGSATGLGKIGRSYRKDLQVEKEIYTIIYNSIHNMTTKTISFRATDDQIHLIDRLVEEGDYTSRGELIRNLLRKVEQKELSMQARKDIEEARKQKGRPLDDLF